MAKLELERVEVRGLKFDVRPGTSDIKAVNEVVGRRSYARRDFVPEPGEHWLDLGGNIGAFSVWAASLGATVDVFEPDPESCERLERNLKINRLRHRVTVHEAAVVGRRDQATAVLHQNVARGNVWRNSIERGWRGETSIEVPCLYVGAVWSPDSCVKMDIEGSEMDILELFGEVTVPKMVFEWTFDVDPSLVRFRRVVKLLQKNYERVHAGTIPEGSTWLPEWFPPCRTVWCWR